jgi:hypothetical protein
MDLDGSNTGFVGSNPTRGIYVLSYFFCDMLSCVDRDLALG